MRFSAKTSEVDAPDSTSADVVMEVPALTVLVPPPNPSVPAPLIGPAKLLLAPSNCSMPLAIVTVPVSTTDAAMALVPVPLIFASVPRFLKLDPAAAPTPISASAAIS